MQCRCISKQAARIVRGRGARRPVVPLELAKEFRLKLVRDRRARGTCARHRRCGRVVTAQMGIDREARAFAARHLAWMAASACDARPRRFARVESGRDLVRGETVRIVRDGVRYRRRMRARTRGLRCQKRASPRDARARASRVPERLLLGRRGRRPVARVHGRDQLRDGARARPRGSIAINWRLLLMPPEVRDYVLWHELMHLKRADHSRAFWALVEEVCPDYRAARAWLLKHGKELA